MLRAAFMESLFGVCSPNRPIRHTSKYHIYFSKSEDSSQRFSNFYSVLILFSREEIHLTSCHLSIKTWRHIVIKRVSFLSSTTTLLVPDSLIPRPTAALLCFTGRSCDEKTPIETGVSIDMAGVTLGESASIESLSPPTSDSLPASDSIAASNRPINDNHPSPLLGVDLPGSQLVPAFVDRGHSEPQKTSTQLLSKGCTNNTPHPPNLGRPVRLPIDAPELQFAPIPIIFDFEPDATPASSPGLDGPVKCSVPIPTENKEGATLRQTTA